ncbi:M1 family metallopeptidase [Arcticibacter svalbardensis]|uniref:M1 family metallopeptidase n=1 Tax=Arcticibacter svalbardensis TaxID=1288027 RepID=UPI001267FFAE|nr:M1 family metallopeptidase [Arcticibacter svalbardensis]
MPFSSNFVKLTGLLCVFISICSFSLEAQSLNETRDIKDAYTKNTRSRDGQPGVKYWQNTATYAISISADPPSRLIKGTETISYTNNSPDTLNKLVIKLILNQHKPGAARYGGSGMDYQTDGIVIDRFSIDGTDGLWDNTNNTTLVDVLLKKSVLPGAHINLEFDWHYDVSKQAGREGMIDSTTFYLGYFYPRVAVYDDYLGWDKTEFTGGQEFYNDFNQYSLKVSVPANYVVWATGVLKNPEQVLQSAIIKKLKIAATADSTISIANKEELLQHKVTLQAERNIWHFEASNVSDIALGLSDHYLWDASSAVVDNKTGRRAEMQAAYSDTAKAFRSIVHDGSYALNWYSHNFPGLPYPYPKMTAFEGNADMEFPMLVNDSSIDGPEGRRVTDHEIAHSWFPFYMGVNESRYAFMDEGWATTLELLIGRSFSDPKAVDKTYRQGRVSHWATDKLAVSQIPIITPSSELKDGYRHNAYGKPSLAYLALKDLLGDDVFKKSLHVYMDRWNGKHPIPWDFFYTFNNVTGKSLNWFWNNWFFSSNYIDLSISSVQKNANGYAVSIANIGGFAIPFDVYLEFADGSNQVIHQTPQIWFANEKKAGLAIKTNKKLKSLRIDGNLFMDSDLRNNSWTTNP